MKKLRNSQKKILEKHQSYYINIKRLICNFFLFSGKLSKSPINMTHPKRYLHTHTHTTISIYQKGNDATDMPAFQRQ